MDGAGVGEGGGGMVDRGLSKALLYPSTKIISLLLEIL